MIACNVGVLVKLSLFSNFFGITSIVPPQGLVCHLQTVCYIAAPKFGKMFTSMHLLSFIIEKAPCSLWHLETIAQPQYSAADSGDFSNSHGALTIRW